MGPCSSRDKNRCDTSSCLHLDTDQVSVCGWFGFVHSKVLSRHFLGRLAVTQDGEQAEEEQPPEQPGAVHGAGPDGYRRGRREGE